MTLLCSLFSHTHARNMHSLLFTHKKLRKRACDSAGQKSSRCQRGLKSPVMLTKSALRCLDRRRHHHAQWPAWLSDAALPV